MERGFFTFSIGLLFRVGRLRGGVRNMHVQRVHYGKLAALLLVVTGFLLLLYRSLPDPRTSLIGNSIMDSINGVVNGDNGVYV